MPNANNILSPVTLIGNGRSGTTLMHDAFARHPDFQTCGETGGLIFAVWEGAKRSFVPQPQEDQRKFSTSPHAKPAHFVQQVVQSLCPSDRPRWFHKPIGLPFKYFDFDALPGQRGANSDFPVEWYWTVLTECFPDSKFITVIRNPFDVALSRLERNGWAVEDSVRDAIVFSEIYEWGWDRLDAVLIFGDLVSDFAGTITELCPKVAAEFDERMIEAIDNDHSSVPGRTAKSDHSDKWNLLSGIKLTEKQVACLSSPWIRMGRELEIPPTINMV